MKRILMISLLILASMSSNVFAVTIKDDYAYTKSGVKISLEDYKLIRKYYHYDDGTIDQFIDSNNVSQYISKAKDVLYSNNYLVKLTVYKDSSIGTNVIPKEEGYELLTNNKQEEHSYKICQPEILIQKIKVDYDIPKEKEDIYTHKDIDYDKFCDREEILLMKAKDQENKTKEEKKMKEKKQKKIIYIVFISLGLILLSVVIFFIIKKVKA